MTKIKVKYLEQVPKGYILPMTNMAFYNEAKWLGYFGLERINGKLYWVRWL